MGCFLIITETDFGQIKHSMESSPWLDRALERADQRGKVLDLSSPLMWGQYVDSVRKDEYKSHHPQAEVQKAVEVIKQGGGRGKGFIDIYDPATNKVIDIKAHNFDSYPSKSRVISATVDIANQMEKYRWSPSIPGHPALEVRFEYTPKNSEYKAFIENFLAGRGIDVVWLGA